MPAPPKRRTTLPESGPVDPLPMDPKSIELRAYGAAQSKLAPPLTNEQRAKIAAIFRAVVPRTQARR